MHFNAVYMQNEGSGYHSKNWNGIVRPCCMVPAFITGPVVSFW